MRTIKLKPRAEELVERKLRLRLPGRLAADLDAYRALYAQTHGREIEMEALIEGILEQFLATDRGFQRRRRVGELNEPRAGSASGDCRDLPV